MKVFGRFFFVMLLVLPSIITLVGHGKSGLSVYAAEDEGEDIIDGEDGQVETDEPAAASDTETTEEPASEKTGEAPLTTDEKEEDEKALKASPHAETKLLFTKPTGTDFPAGSLVRLLVGFTNKGAKDFNVDSMEASFRYPQDFSYYIQNFTSLRYDRVVEPKRQATFEYQFIPSEQLTARPFGLTINLNYRDIDGNIFQDTVFNDTVNIVELDEGLDGETFFLYVFLAAVVVLLLVGAQQLLQSFSSSRWWNDLQKKRLSRPKPRVEMGTQNTTDVDYDWIPQGHLPDKNKSPRRSPKQSPRERKTRKRATGASDEK